MEDRSSPGRRKRGTGEEGRQERRGERGSQRAGKRARTDKRPSTRNRDDRPERGQTRHRGVQPPPPDRVKPRSPDVSRRRQPRSNRAGDERGPDATGQIQGRETPDASRQPEGGHTPGQAGKIDGRDEFEPGPNEGQHRIQKARTEPQRSQNRQTGKHRGQESPDLNLRSITAGAPPPQPRVGSPACRGSV